MASPDWSYPDHASRSAGLHQRARRVLPDGVSRSTVLIRPYPLYVASGRGAWITDVDGRRYLDANGNFTSIILGHADPVVNGAVAAQLARGTAFSLATEAELELAELLCDRVPSFERIRFGNSGTEAVMGAIKAARAFTGRPMIAKVEGAYHGTYDHAETSLGSGPPDWGEPASPASVPYSAGAPESVARETAVLPFNDAAAARSVLDRCGAGLAAVLIDTLPSRVGMPTPDPEFLRAVTSTARAVGALVILDEVISFRLGPGGNQGRLGLEPDLTALGKIIGGGFPVGAVAGRADVMAVFESVDGARPRVPSGGTFSANAVTMVAGTACMAQLTDASFQRLADLGERARAGFRSAFEATAVDWQVTGEGSLFRLHPHARPIRGYRDTHHSPGEAATMAALQHRLLERQVYLSSYGMGCLNLAMTDADVDHLVAAVADALPLVAQR
jgi:glutamate-1-semialdehyde 2,1-aminomutase